MLKQRQYPDANDDEGEDDKFLKESSDDEGLPVNSRRPVPTRRPRPSVAAISVSPSPRVSTFEGPISEMFTYERKGRISEQSCRLVLYIAVGLLSLTTLALAGLLVYQMVVPDQVYYCGYTDTEHVSSRDFTAPDVFDDLTPVEYDAVTSFLTNNADLGLTDATTATPDSSYIILIELMPPDKDEAIQYLEVGAKKPDRAAKVVVVRGNGSPPVVQEYVVSPLSPPMTVQEYINPSYRRYPIPYSSRPLDRVERQYLFSTIIYKATKQMYPLLKESYGRYFHNCSEVNSTCLEIFDLAPGGVQDNERKTWIWLYPEVQDFFVRPLGVQFLVEHSSSYVGNWSIERVIYNGKEFASVETLMFLYQEKSLDVAYLDRANGYMDHFSYRPRELPSSPPPQGPKPFDPEGKRFDIRGQHIAYHNWEFYYHMRPSTGMVLFDLRFNNARIAYEISLQEVVVLYSGYGPSHGNGYFFDSAWFIGESSMELARGIDCPDTAVYLNTYVLGLSGRPVLQKNNVCVFERNPGRPLRRHYSTDASGRFSSYGGLPDYHLVIRTIATIRNSDYILDYIFYNDGVVEGRAAITGYMHATYWADENTEVVNGIYRSTMFNVHQRVFNYKVDLDVAGDRNSYNVLDAIFDTDNDTHEPGGNKTKIRLNQTVFETETTRPVFTSGTPQFHIMSSSGDRNQFGAKRAYQIVNKSPSSFLLTDITNINATSWASYPIAVTRRKHEEQQSSSIYANYNPWNPVVDFSEFLDGDDMLDDDLVAWITMGTHHLSGTEDMPSMTTSRGAMSFLLTPHNFFSECPSTTSPDVVVIKPSSEGNGKNKVESFGKAFNSNCLQKYVGPYFYDGLRRVQDVHKYLNIFEEDDDKDDDNENNNDNDN